MEAVVATAVMVLAILGIAFPIVVISAYTLDRDIVESNPIVIEKVLYKCEAIK